VRNIVRFVDSLPWTYGLGFAAAICNREQRRLGDLAAGTLVVHVERKARPIRALHEGPSANVRQRQATIRQRLGQLNREQKQTLIDLCLRRDQLRITDRVQLFRAAAECLTERLKFSPEEHESDEKFVLEMVAVLGERTPPEPEVLVALPARKRVG